MAPIGFYSFRQTHKLNEDGEAIHDTVKLCYYSNLEPTLNPLHASTIVFLSQKLRWKNKTIK